MRVIVVASRKGGSGKTVTCRHLAVEAMRCGMSRVALIDLDPMRGLTKWWQRRPGDGIELVDLGPGGAAKLGEAVRSLRAQGYAALFIDTPPAADDTVRRAAAVADIVLAPVRPSPDDLDAIGETIQVVTKSGKPILFVINAATRKARLTGDAAIALSQHGRVAGQIIHRADAFAASALTGGTVQEADARGTPAAEVASLWRYVAGQLGIEVAGSPVSKPANPLTGPRAIGEIG